MQLDLSNLRKPRVTLVLLTFTFSPFGTNSLVSVFMGISGISLLSRGLNLNFLCLVYLWYGNGCRALPIYSSLRIGECRQFPCTLFKWPLGFTRLAFSLLVNANFSFSLACRCIFSALFTNLAYCFQALPFLIPDKHARLPSPYPLDELLVSTSPGFFCSLSLLGALRHHAALLARYPSIWLMRYPSTKTIKDCLHEDLPTQKSLISWVLTQMSWHLLVSVLNLDNDNSIWWSIDDLRHIPDCDGRLFAKLRFDPYGQLFHLMDGLLLPFIMPVHGCIFPMFEHVIRRKLIFWSSYSDA